MVQGIFFTAGLVRIIVFVSRSCGEIFMSGGDCGIGYRWFGLVGEFLGLGGVRMYRLVRVKKLSSMKRRAYHPGKG